MSSKLGAIHLWDSIQSGAYPEWELGLQLFDEEFADQFDFDILDPTKLIPEELVPVKIVGKMVLNETVDNFFAETEQVAFCTQNIIPGIDFTDDPLLQGRNFSYLDTQTKRLGGPNFTHIPVNAPRCPLHHFQQDGHMAMTNPSGRANYEPNSWGKDGGSRENPEEGFKSVPVEHSGTKQRKRSPTFSDHYSQARQFFISQTKVEQKHIGDALTFELSKVEHPHIRERMVAHLLNIDEQLASSVADGLGIEQLPSPADAACPTRQDLPESPALSILKNIPSSFSGRKLGVLVTDGSPADYLSAICKYARKSGVMIEFVAPTISGVHDSNHDEIKVSQKIDGGPSVLYDAVILMPDATAVSELAKDATTKDFVNDAFAHCKFVGYTDAAKPLFDATNLTAMLDRGCVFLKKPKHVETFIKTCGQLRFWKRETKVDHT